MYTQIECNPCLYNTKDPSYYDRDMRLKATTEATAMARVALAAALFAHCCDSLIDAPCINSVLYVSQCNMCLWAEAVACGTPISKGVDK